LAFGALPVSSAAATPDTTTTNATTAAAAAQRTRLGRRPVAGGGVGVAGVVGAGVVTPFSYGVAAGCAGGTV
jgi:hypothetical protein